MSLSRLSNKAQGQVSKVNEIEIWYETFGEKQNKPLLLIMGGCCQGILWHKAFCQALAQEGFYVIRYDHRDAGLSTCFDFEKTPYSLMDMTKDAIGLLDLLQIEKAYLFGVSLGAFIAAVMAAYFPNKVISSLLLGSSCEIRPMNLVYAGKLLDKEYPLPHPKQEYLDWMHEFMKLSPKTKEDQLIQRMEGWNRLSGHKYPLNEQINRQMQEEFLERLRSPKGIVNHIAMLNTPEAEELIRTAPTQVQKPTIILHGSEDPIFSPEHGEALSRKIPHSEYHLVNGMGHIPSDHFYDLYINTLKKLIT